MMNITDLKQLQIDNNHRKHCNHKDSHQIIILSKIKKNWKLLNRKHSQKLLKNKNLNNNNRHCHRQNP
jgi:hypothetical protein